MAASPLPAVPKRRRCKTQRSIGDTHTSDGVVVVDSMGVRFITEVTNSQAGGRVETGRSKGSGLT